MSAMSQHSSLDASADHISVLDHALKNLQVGNTIQAVEDLFDGLARMRQELPDESWKSFATRTCLKHPMRTILHQDPFTHHAFVKPRGYAGDPQLIDYIYGNASLPEDATDLGRIVHEYVNHAPASKSVIARRDVLSQLADQTAERVHGAHILSVACGHMREAQKSVAVREGSIAEWIGIDQDADSVAYVNREQRGTCVRAEVGSVRSILSNKLKLGSFDLIYSACLYDYLEDRTATRMTARMFDMLSPGGSVVVANFAPTLRDIGYMESFMAWDLIYRDEGQMPALANDIDADQIESTETFWDEPGNIVFLQVTKKEKKL